MVFIYLFLMFVFYNVIQKSLKKNSLFNFYPLLKLGLIIIPCILMVFFKWGVLLSCTLALGIYSFLIQKLHIKEKKIKNFVIITLLLFKNNSPAQY